MMSLVPGARSSSRRCVACYLPARARRICSTRVLRYETSVLPGWQVVSCEFVAVELLHRPHDVARTGGAWFCAGEPRGN
jgi:hypothetical protein